jgi:hypothetical protein
MSLVSLLRDAHERRTQNGSVDVSVMDGRDRNAGRPTHRMKQTRDEWGTDCREIEGNTVCGPAPGNAAVSSVLATVAEAGEFVIPQSAEKWDVGGHSGAVGLEGLLKANGKQALLRVNADLGAYKKKEDTGGKHRPPSACGSGGQQHSQHR